MNLKSFFTGFVLTVIVIGFTACNSNSDKNKGTTDNNTSASTANEGTNPKGIGQYKDIQLTHPLDEKMVEAGKGIYDVKCASCHKITDEKLVGPGWKGVTDRRTPEWIMNFVTNTDEMIEKDTAAQKLLEVCLVKMPNQNLAEADARSVLEFMRKNDGKK
ncbi:MAG: c-type cytochrome [Flavisolibacter sp.]